VQISAEFVTSASGAGDFPKEQLPEVALVGRSNVGKSSLLNALMRQALARTSAAPGKTRLANLYRLLIDGGPGGPGTPGGAGQWSVYFADLPGFGYARGGAASVAELAQIAGAYFESDHLIAGVLHLVDSRHPGLDADLDAARWLQSLGQGGLARASIATKVDKLSRRERVKNLKELERQLGMATLPISAVTGEGLDDLWTLIARLSRQ